MLARVVTFTVEGVEGREVIAEVDVRRGLPAFSLVGLPDASVREARERVRAAVLNSGFEFPQQRLTANLAPAAIRKAGPAFDLAIAVGVLAASGQVPASSLEGTVLCGELSLGGELRRVKGILAAALGARARGHRRMIVPEANAGEAVLGGGVEVLAVPTLARLVDVLYGRWQPEPAKEARPRIEDRAPLPDLAEVRGQADAKRALEIAAAGGHNLLMVGPPGAGKTMVARRMPGILPPPTRDEALEITRIHSVAGTGGGGLATERPFRAPHHTVSPQGLVGGGARPQPGEMTLAHRGVLFLDELAEYSRGALEALRQPLEDGHVEITRGQRSLTFPTRVMLIAACNPCPCGALTGECSCSEIERDRYQRRLSGPLLDRIDLVCRVATPPRPELVGAAPGTEEGSAAIAARVVAARERQRRRLVGTRALCNGEMDGALTRRTVRLEQRSIERLLSAQSLTGRGHDRVLRLARTIADLDGCGEVGEDDVAEALGYRVAAPLAVAA